MPHSTMDLNHITQLSLRQMHPPTPPMLCTHFLCRTELRVLKCDEQLGDGAVCICSVAVNVNEKLQRGTSEVWRWSCVISGRWLCVCVHLEGSVYQSHSDTLSKVLCVPILEREQLWASAQLSIRARPQPHAPLISHAALCSSPVLSSG